MHKHSVGRGHLLSEVMCVCLSALLFFLSCPVTFHELIFNYLSLSNLLRQNSCVSDQIKLVDHLWQRQRCLGEQGGGGGFGNREDTTTGGHTVLIYIVC